MRDGFVSILNILLRGLVKQSQFNGGGVAAQLGHPVYEAKGGAVTLVLVREVSAEFHHLRGRGGKKKCVKNCGRAYIEF